MKPAQLSLVEISGSLAAAGRTYGERFATGVVGFCRQEMKPDLKRLRWAKRYQTPLAKHAPRAWAFLRGVAQGCELTEEHLTLLALHEEVVHIPHCTAFVAGGTATQGGKTLLGQNWDWSPAMFPWPGMLRLAIDKTPRMLLYHYPGLWACAGVNEAGLSLMWTGAGYLPKTPPIMGVPTYPLIHEVLSRRDVPQALAYLEQTPNAGAFIFFLGDAQGNTAVVEAVPGRKIIDQSRPVLTRANHYVCPELVQASKQKLPRTFRISTACRQRLVDQLLARPRPLTAAHGRAVLCDRTGAWPWLNQYPAAAGGRELTGMTIDSLLVSCQERRLWTCRGGKTLGSWQSFRV